MKEKIQILCFGDSNTYGTITEYKKPILLYNRYGEDIRWTSRLQKLLGTKFNIIEEGLGGRTTIYETETEPFCRYSNGLAYISGILMTHAPIDLVIVMLGTNDLQAKNPPDEESLGLGIERIIDEIKSIPQCGRNNQSPFILVVSPIHFKKSLYRPEIFIRFRGNKGIELSHMFSKVYKEIASRKACYFLDASLYAFPSDIDGVHFTEAGHISLADALNKKIQEIFS